MCINIHVLLANANGRLLIETFKLNNMQDRTKFNEFENKVIKFVSESDNQEMMDTFLEWQNERNRLNQEFIDFINRESRKTPMPKETPIHERWMFVANNDLPKEDGRYYCLDKFGEQGWCLWGNSGAPNENTYFFDTKDGIQAKHIIC